MMKLILILVLSALPASAAIDVATARDLLITKCGSCHRGPFLDFSKYPFFSDLFPTERELLTEGIRRAKLTDRKRMPPVNYAPLDAAEIELLEGYLSTIE